MRTVTILLLISSAFCVSARKLEARALKHTPSLDNSCLSEEVLRSTISQLSGGTTEAVHAQESLVRDARMGVNCRIQVIKGLGDVMSKNSTIDRDAASYYFWRYGASILAELKAVEALDLLTSHLTLNDGTSSFGIPHRPAASAVIEIGSPAIPKLYSLIQESSDRKTRLYAVYCLGLIGGPSARAALTRANRRETDTCVKAFIQMTLHAFNNARAPNKVTSRDRTEWLLAFSCDGAA